jgi:hypothetical protein
LLQLAKTSLEAVQKQIRMDFKNRQNHPQAPEKKPENKANDIMPPGDFTPKRAKINAAHAVPASRSELCIPNFEASILGTIRPGIEVAFNIAS